jgi:hypothetical protein
MLTTSSGPYVPKSNESEWVQAHEVLSRLARERAAADAEEGRWLLVALRSAAHVHLGYGTFGEYIERLFGYKPRSIQERLRVAEALEELPATRVALETGALNWSAVRELTRVAVAETEHDWLEVARGKTVHQLQALVAGKPRGAAPSSPASPETRRHVLRFEVASETLCLFREAMNKLQRDSGASLDDDSALMLMARHVLGGPGEEGRAAYQIALSVCPRCSQGAQQASGELMPVDPEIVAMAECDAQHLGVLPPAGPSTPASAAPALRAVERVEPDVHTGARAEAKAERADDAHTGARAEAKAERADDAHAGARAKQDVPPAMRRTVLRRDHHRCTAPGCRNVRFVDVHHIQLSSEGGCNRVSNLITLCSVHHRAAHRGELLVSGSVEDGVCFRHADGSDYGQPLDPHAVDVQAKAFAILRNLQFREGETRQVLTELGKKYGGQLPSLERLLRDALDQLTPPTRDQATSDKRRQI